MISSRNSTRHGFYATSVLLPDEDREEFIRLARRLAVCYAPTGVLEEEQVRIIIETRWQLRRANLVDTELFQIYRCSRGRTARRGDRVRAGRHSRKRFFQTHSIPEFSSPENLSR